MNPETPFLDAIRADPNHSACRLVYADWLEERGDPRAELIRIEEEMRPLPVFSDRFWELKPRRHELRERSPQDWLQMMRYGTDCPPTFAHTPNGWKEWWRLIRVFTERWHGFASLPDVGGRLDEVREAEARLGRRLPPSMCEWVAFAHDVRPSPDMPIVLRDDYRMIEMENHAAISLLILCEGNLQWAVRHEDLQSIDPPVHTYIWDYNSPDGQTFVVHKDAPVVDTLTSFVMGYSLGYIHAEGGGFGTQVTDSADLVQRLRKDCSTHFKFGNVDLFENENVLVQLHRGPQRDYLSVEVFKQIARDLIPSYLLDYTHNGGSFHGMFTPEIQ